MTLRNADTTGPLSKSARVLRTPEAAIRLGVSKATLEKWRITGNGPAFVRLSSRAIGYRECDLELFAASRLVRSTSEIATI